MDPRWDSKRRQVFLDTVENPGSSSKYDNHRNLKTKILSMHGGDSWEEICYLERTRMKIERRAVVTINELKTFFNFFIQLS